MKEPNCNPITPEAAATLGSSRASDGFRPLETILYRGNRNLSRPRKLALIRMAKALAVDGTSSFKGMRSTAMISLIRVLVEHGMLIPSGNRAYQAHPAFRAFLQRLPENPDSAHCRREAPYCPIGEYADALEHFDNVRDLTTLPGGFLRMTRSRTALLRGLARILPTTEDAVPIPVTSFTKLGLSLTNTSNALSTLCAAGLLIPVNQEYSRTCPCTYKAHPAFKRFLDRIFK